MEILIKLRKYKLINIDKENDTITHLVNISRYKKKALIWSIINKSTIGVAIVNQLSKKMGDSNIEIGIIVSSGRYTHAAKIKAVKRNIELIPKTFPAFNIFEHDLVPKHEILTDKEKEQLLLDKKIKPYQFPQIKASDPAAKAIGAKPGDILRIIRESPTAGKFTSFRHVVE